MHGGSAVWLCGMGFQEDGGAIDGVERRCIDGSWRKEGRQKKRGGRLVKEARGPAGGEKERRRFRKRELVRKTGWSRVDRGA